MKFITAGESHGKCVTAIIEGLPAGLIVDVDEINHELKRRQTGYGRGGRMKIEKDEVNIEGGMLYGKTIGAPLVLRIDNKDWDNWKEKWEKGDLEPLVVPRPGHADFAGMIKYRFEDARLVLERASARETTARVAVGAVMKQFLTLFGITVGSFVNEIGGVIANPKEKKWEKLFLMAENSVVRMPDPQAEKDVIEKIDLARKEGDTLGGVFTVTALNVPVGLGSYVHWEKRLDARLANAVMSIQAIKGVEIGPAFDNARHWGTEVHDDLFLDEYGKIIRKTNNAGGIEGGISNGEPIVVRAAMKPIATTIKPHQSINMKTKEAATYIYQRSDYCAVPAASIVGEAMVAWVIADAMLEKWGGDSVEEIIERWTREKTSF